MGCGASTASNSRASLLVERGVDERIGSRPESCSLSGVVGHLDETLKIALNDRPSMEAETQTTRTWQQAGGAGKRDPVASEVAYGPLRVRQPSMQTLFVFAREDSQSDALCWAAERGRYRYDIAKDRQTARAAYRERHHELVIIDLRSQKSLDGEEVCRCIRAANRSEYTVIVGIVNSCQKNVDVDRLLSTGFNRIIPENVDVRSCLAELVTMERGEVRSQFKLLTSTAFVAAVEHSYDSVEVSSKEAVYQYVNPAYEKITGYKCDEVIGRTPRHFKSNKTEPALLEDMDSTLKSGSDWEGRIFGRRKTGEDYPEEVRVVPVFAPSGQVIHHVAIKSDISQQVEAYANLRQAARSVAEVQEELHQSPIVNPKNGRRSRKMMTSETLAGGSGSKDSVAPETSLEKVMSMLNKAQEQTRHPVVQSLDRVVELLRSSELYSPWSIDDDPRLRDFVGGLMGPSRHKLQTTLSIDAIRSEEDLVRWNSRGEVRHALEPLENASSDVRDLLVMDSYWNFDIVRLEKITEKRPLYWLGQKIFRRLNICSLLKISESTLMIWLQRIEANYHAVNTYHNSTHAADVLHSAAYFMECSKVKELLDWQDVVAVLIAAIIHDIDHPGRTNSFLCASGHPLAILYNDTAVLESHHAAFAFKITTSGEGCNILKGLPPEDYRDVRRAVIDMVLATDMTKHFEYLKKFETFLKLTSTDGATEPQLGNSPEFKTAAKRILIKSADIANPARPWELCKVWAHRIAQEYFDQTDEEKRLGLPLHLPAFDRETCNISKTQVQFIEFFVLDLFSVWNRFANISNPMEHLNSNYERWKKESAEEQQQKQQQQQQKQQRPRTPVSVISSRTSNSSFSLPVDEVS
ncbi:high affinity cAMP-specific and IBMX-insensitive 3',5'-cyclic phosphodiesterase 8A-like [Oscarella lobularis]|uniref:high affinity cAMP-specific and IBMX-insensitive 3',5'-cyclic phosphodiesterase 8A-like n=1 Tax=Oscarella lobularis TaxID=121494 RepID=UPI0033144EDE